MAQTKVAKLIKVLQDDNLAAGVFEAIVKNDEDIFKEVLEDTNLSSTDFSLSEDEIENYIEGLEPSGTLDLCTFEGYYESEDWPPDKSQFAFLILSSTEKVYCASRDELLADPSKHAVEHTLTQGGWLNFVTPHWGLVNIRFQRDWDEEDGTSWCRFVGACDGKRITGRQTAPPLDQEGNNTDATVTTETKAEQIQKSSAVKDFFTTTKVALEVAGDGKPDGPPVKIDLWTVGLPLLFTYIGGIVGIIQMVLWCRQAVVNTAELRQRCCDQLRNTLRRGGREVWRRAARRRLPALQVDFTNATRKTSADVEVGLNQEFHDNTPEFQQNEMDALIERNVPIAEQAGTSSIRRQIRSQIVTTVDVEMENFRFIDDPDELAAEILNENVEKLAEPRISKLDGTWLKPTRAALLEERERQCSSDYNAKEAVYEGAQANYEEEKQKRENIEAQIEKIDKDGTNTEDEKKRRAQLEDDLAKAKESEKESEKMKNEAEDAKEKAKRDADKAEEEKKDDTSAEDFEKDLDKAFESGK